MIVSLTAPSPTASPRVILPFGSIDRFLSREAMEDHRQIFEGYLAALLRLQQQKIAVPEESRPDSGFRSASLQKQRCQNAVVLHQTFFESLFPTPTEMPKAVERMLAKHFGSPTRALSHLRAAALCVPTGWAVLSYDPLMDAMQVLTLTDHDTGVVFRQVALLAIDVWEHAYFADWGRDRKGYLDGFFAHIDWDFFQKRLDRRS